VKIAAPRGSASRHHNTDNNIVICKACKVSGNNESEVSAVARWAALVGYAKRNVLRRRLMVSVVGESCIKRQIIPNCGCKVAEGSFSKFSGEPWTIKKKLVI